MKVATTTLINDISTMHSELPKRITRAVIKDFLDLVCESLIQGKDLRIDGLGVFKIKNRAARIGRNPQSGEVIKIKATRRVCFRPSAALKAGV